MSTYLDTSLVVAALTAEAASERARAWLDAQPAESMFISGWVNTEIASALALKVRVGTIDVARRAEALTIWTRLVEASAIILPIIDEDFAHAAHLADRVELGLRAGDALHLAIAASHGLAIATLDRQFAAAALAVGVPLADLG